MNIHPDYLLTMINNEHAVLAAEMARRSTKDPPRSTTAPRRCKPGRLSRIGAMLTLPTSSGHGRRHRVMAVQLDSEMPPGMPRPGPVG